MPDRIVRVEAELAGYSAASNVAAHAARHAVSSLDRTIARSKEQLYVIDDLVLENGQHLKDARINFVTLGTPQRDANGCINNAVLLIHGTASNWRAYADSWWTKAMYGPGQPLDLERTFVVISDNLGAGHSSKPSDGLRMTFPRYQHSDVVEAQHRLISEHLGIAQLCAAIGSSYGGRLCWQWAIQHPTALRGVIPMIASPFANAGRRGMQDYLGQEPLLSDPSWQGGEYAQQPRNFRLALMAYWVFLDGAQHLWEVAPTRAQALHYLPELAIKLAASLDANDWIYQLRVNDDFDAASSLDRITAQVLAIELEGDEMVPVELGQIDQVKQRLGERIDYLLIKDSGRGHSALPHVINKVAPRIGAFLQGLD